MFFATSIFWIIALFLLVLLARGTFFTVSQQSCAIVERFGKFHALRGAGLHLKIPLIDRLVHRLNLRILQLDVHVETKTHDNVFVAMQVSVQFRVIEEAVYNAYYKLDDPHTQITAYIFDVVRAEVPRMSLDDVFAKKDSVASAICEQLQDAMEGYGYYIEKALVTDIEPAEQVKQAMNRINAAERAKKAAEFEAEAEKIKIIAHAEAEAESKKLQGAGIANQRKEIAHGLQESVQMLNSVNIPSIEASALILVTQHYDTLQAVGARTNSNLILLPNAPEAAGQLLANTIAAFSAAGHAGQCTPPVKAE